MFFTKEAEYLEGKERIYIFYRPGLNPGSVICYVILSKFNYVFFLKKICGMSTTTARIIMVTNTAKSAIIPASHWGFVINRYQIFKTPSAGIN